MKNNSTLTHRLPGWGSRIPWILAAALLLGSMAWAQTDEQQDPGQVVNGFELRQTAEFGGRISHSNGSNAIFTDFVDLKSGPRLMEYTLQLHALEHKGGYIDDLSWTNTGYGGDPETVTRIRASRNRWYDFSAQMRRNINFYDYNAFSNPYNYGPTISNTTRPSFVTFNDSVHMMNTRRKMGDFNLTILPQSKVRFRFGYTRVLNEGPTYSSYHDGTDIQLLQNYDVQQDAWQFGMDYTLAPRTSLSYDHILTVGDVATGYKDPNVGRAFLSSGGQNIPIDPGAIWNFYYGQPCAAPTVTSGVLTPANCGVYLGYTRTGDIHTNLPSDKLSFTSRYWKKLDVSASAGYSYGGTYIRNYNEQENAWISRTNQLGDTIRGTTNATQNTSFLDLGATFYITDAWSISNQTRWVNYRQPSFFNSATTVCFPNATSGVTALSQPGTPFGNFPTCGGVFASGTPQHTSSSPADYTLLMYLRSWNRATAYNTTTLSWAPSKRFGTHVGYRYGRVHDTATDFDSQTATYLGANFGAGNTRLAPGTYVTPLPDADDALVTDDHQTEHALLFGFQLRPVDSWRINGDWEYVYDNIALAPISPQHASRVKLRSTYRFSRWLTASGSALLIDNRNDVVAQNPDGTNAFPVGYHNPRHTDSSNAYAFNLAFEPNKYFTFDLGYTFNHFESQGGTCMMASSGGGNVQSLTPEGGAISRCPNVSDPFVPGVAGAPIPTVLNYAQSLNTIYTALLIHPVKRVTLSFGIDSTINDGKNAWLRADTLAPLRYPVDATGNVVYGGNALAGPVVGYVDAPNPFQPLGPLYMKWLKPNAGVQVEFSKKLTFKGGFQYWDYREKGATGPMPGLLYPVTPRNFTANAGTLALRYSF